MTPANLNSLQSKFGPFDAEQWVLNPDNILKENEAGDTALFQKNRNGEYLLHCHFTTRGKEGLQVAREMIEEVFRDHEGVQVLTGLAPIANKPVRWFSRKLGFKSYGTVDLRDLGVHEILILTRKEYE